MKRSILSRRWFRAFLYSVMFAGLGTASWPFGQVAMGWWNQRALRQAWNEQVQNEQVRNERAVEVSSEKTERAPGKSLPHRSPQSPNKKTKPIVVKRVKTKPAPARWQPTRLIIPDIDVDAIVLRGVDDDALKKGPGHDRASALPGQKGNCVIAAHRNSYGWWFYNLGEVGNNTQIELRTPSKSYHYKVVSTQVLPDDATWVLRPPTDPKAAPRLTLYTCALPHGSNRIVVTAIYTGQKKTTS